MFNKNVILKGVLAGIGFVMLVFSGYLLYTSTSIKKTHGVLENPVLSVTSTQINYFPGSNTPNPKIKSVLGDTSDIKGFQLAYHVDGADTEFAKDNYLIKPEPKIQNNWNCSTTYNGDTDLFRIFCYGDTITFDSDQVIAEIDLVNVNQSAPAGKVEISINEAFSYISDRNNDIALTTNTGSVSINNAVMPKECDNKPLADLNCDGRINTVDLSYFYKDPSEIPEYIYYRMDLNNDGQVDKEDQEILINTFR